MRAPGVSLVQIFGLKMGPEFHKIFKLFEELEEAGQTATLTFTSKGGKSTFKLQLESSPSSPSTTSPTPPAASAPAPGGRRRRHRGAAARARRRQRAADHQGTTLAASASVSPSSSLPDPGEASVPAGPQHGLLPQRRPLFPVILPTPSPSTGRRRVMSLARLPLPSFGSLNIDGHPPSPPPRPPSPPPPPPQTLVTSTALRVKAAPWEGKKCCGIATMADAMAEQVRIKRRRLTFTRSCCSCSSSSSVARQHVCSSSGSSASSAWDDSEIDSDECFE